MKKATEGITREQLQKIYQDNDSKKAAKILGVSTATLYDYLDQYKIPLKGRGGRKPKKLWIIG